LAFKVIIFWRSFRRNTVSEILWSVVVPTYNRLPILQKCLTALENQTITQPYEVVVVDDGSTDGTV